MTLNLIIKAYATAQDGPEIEYTARDNAEDGDWGRIGFVHCQIASREILASGQAMLALPRNTFSVCG